jgi:hypothetical protein
MATDLIKEGYQPGCYFSLNEELVVDKHVYPAGALFKATGVTTDEVNALVCINATWRVLSFPGNIVTLQSPPEVPVPKRCPAFDRFLDKLAEWSRPDPKDSSSLAGCLFNVASVTHRLRENPDDFTLYASSLFWLLSSAFRAGFSFIDLRKGLSALLDGCIERKETAETALSIPVGGPLPDLLSPMLRDMGTFRDFTPAAEDEFVLVNADNGRSARCKVQEVDNGIDLRLEHHDGYLTGDAPVVLRIDSGGNLAIRVKTYSGSPAYSEIARLHYLRAR